MQNIYNPKDELNVTSAGEGVSTVVGQWAAEASTLVVAFVRYALLD
jgi:hypothetical protein